MTSGKLGLQLRQAEVHWDCSIKHQSSCKDMFKPEVAGCSSVRLGKAASSMDGEQKRVKVSVKHAVAYQNNLLSWKEWRFAGKGWRQRRNLGQKAPPRGSTFHDGLKTPLDGLVLGPRWAVCDKPSSGSAASSRASIHTFYARFSLLPDAGGGILKHLEIPLGARAVDRDQPGLTRWLNQLDPRDRALPTRRYASRPPWSPSAILRGWSDTPKNAP
ncbi:hypothetical protein NL676_023839 [Syzygium grande]|nr:hypothetical protein NL676_023839 [Syzygium grande]